MSRRLSYSADEGHSVVMLERCGELRRKAMIYTSRCPVLMESQHCRTTCWRSTPPDLILICSDSTGLRHWLTMRLGDGEPFLTVLLTRH